MGRFSNCLLVSDFDRTMTDRQSRIPQANLDAISEFIAQGGAFTIATGRSLATGRYRLRDIPMNAPLLCFNGAACYDLQTEELLFCHPLPEDGLALMQHYESTRPDLLLEVHCLDGHYVFHPNDDRDAYLRQQHAPFVHATWDMVPELKINFAIYSSRMNPFLMAPDDPEAVQFHQLADEINAWGQGRYVAINSLPGMVEVQSAKGSKGIAARELANRLHRSVLIAAGDAPNDEAMLLEADLGFLAADGEASMQAKGFRQAAPCAEGTVADVIRQLKTML